MKRPLLLTAALIGLTLGMLLLAAWLVNQGGLRPAPEASLPALDSLDSAGLIGSRRPDFHLPDHQGRLHRVADWDGRVLVVNFWATWCLPCRREIPAFIELQQAYGGQGLQFVGIALDTRREVQRFVDELGLAVNFPLLIADDDAGIALAMDYGNRFGILPYTVIIDRAGSVSLVQYGEISHRQAEKAILELL